MSTPTSSQPRGLGYRADIDGLRAVAIILVVLFHVGIPGFSGGFAGVDVFFVISGFLITGLLVGDLETYGRVRYAEFYARRVRRLLPALTVVLLATLVLGTILLLPWQLRDLTKSTLAAATFVSNVYFWRSLSGYFAQVAGDQPLLHTWSLGVEEQFYLLWPITLFVAWRLAQRLRLPAARTLLIATGGLSGTSLLLAVAVAHRNPSAVFYLLPTRLWELGVGGMLAIGRPTLGRTIRMPLAAAGAVGVVVTAFAVHGTTGWPGLHALPVVLGTGALIVGGIDGTTPVNRLLATRPAVLVGRLSYSWYLWHWPLLVLVRTDTLRVDRLRDSGIALLALALAGLTYVLVEQPIRKRRLRFVARTRPALVFGLALVAVSIGGALVATGESKANPFSAARNWDWGCMLLNHSDPIRVPSQCVPVPHGHGTIALVGDSHAAMFQTPLERVAHERHMRLEVATRAGCAFVRGGLRASCTNSYEAGLADLLRQRRSVRLVVISYRSPDYAPGGTKWAGPKHAPPAARSLATWRAAVREPVRALTRAGIPVLFILPTPEPLSNPFDTDVPTCLSRRSASDCAFRTANALRNAEPTLTAERLAAKGSPLAATWSAFPYFCGPAICKVEKDGRSLFADGHHFSTFASLQLLATLRPAIASALELAKAS